MRPQPWRRPITRKDYAQGQGRTVPCLASSRRARARLRRLCLRTTRDIATNPRGKRYIRIHVSTVLRTCVTIQHWCVRAVVLVTPPSPTRSCQQEQTVNQNSKVYQRRARSFLDVPNLFSTSRHHLETSIEKIRCQKKKRKKKQNKFPKKQTVQTNYIYAVLQLCFKRLGKLSNSTRVFRILDAKRSALSP